MIANRTNRVLRKADEIRADIRTVHVWCGEVHTADRAARRIADDAAALLDQAAELREKTRVMHRRAQAAEAQIGVRQPTPQRAAPAGCSPRS